MSPEPLSQTDVAQTQLDTVHQFAEATGMSDQLEFDAVRTVIYGERDAYGYSGEYEPKVVTADEAFDAMSHSEIYARVQEFDPESIVESAQNWQALMKSTATASTDFSDAMNGAIGQGWTGATADAVTRGVEQYRSASGDLHTAMALISNKVREAYTGFEQTKLTVPPVPESPGLVTMFKEAVVARFLPIPGLIKTAEYEREEAEQQARQIMKTVYVPVVHQSDDQVPVLPTAYNPMSDTGGGGPVSFPGFIPDGPGQGGTPWPGGGSGPLPQTGSGPGADTNGPAADQGPPGSSAAQPSGTQPSAASDGAAPNSSPGTDTDGQTRPTTSSTGAQPTSGAGGNGSGSPYGGSGASSQYGGSGGSGGGSTYGGGSGYSSGSGGGSQYGGNSVLGSGSSGGSAAGAAGGPAGQPGSAVGRAGAPGMGGMAPGSRGGSGEGDGDHKSASYLVDASNGSELVGDLPLVAPPVLGG